jgi:hypothetical protein
VVTGLSQAAALLHLLYLHWSRCALVRSESWEQQQKKARVLLLSELVVLRQ